MLKDLLEYLAKSLVDNPDEVHVEATETDTTVVLELSVAKDDVGKVIGKQGRIARALRTIVKASAVRDGKRAIVEIIDCAASHVRLSGPAESSARSTDSADSST